MQDSYAIIIADFVMAKFRLNSVEFKEPLENKYKCILCGFVLQTPVQSISCGHRFCKKCIHDELQKGNPHCPEDNEPLDSKLIFPDVCARKEVSELECYCPNRKQGCLWANKFGEVEQHEKECPYGLVKCLYENYGCKEVLQRWQLAKHLEKECEFRPFVCEFCKKNILQEEEEEHFNICPKYPTVCPKCGKTDIPQDALEAHCSGECPMREVQCSFHSLGCDHKCQQENLMGHLSEAIQDHLFLSSKFAEDSLKQTENITKELKETVEKNKALEQQLKNQNEVLVNARDTLSSQQTKLNKIEKFLTEQKQNYSQIIQRLDSGNTSLELKSAIEELQKQFTLQKKNLEQLELEVRQKKSSGGGASGSEGGRHDHILTLLDIQLAEHDLKIQILEATTYDGIFLWKIDDFSRRFHEAVTNKTPSLYSPPFYTSRFGYKVCGRLYINGDGVGKGTHMSLFFVVMRGEYDAMLTWPFRNRVTLKLLDHDHQHDITESFLPDTTSSSFARPRTHMNTASGCPLFCSHTVLRSRSYIRDDVFFIKIQVDSIQY